MITEVISFCNDNVNELKSEFWVEFTRILDEGTIGWYTFYFSSYQDYTIRTEYINCYISNKTALFYVNPCSMLLTLNHELLVNNGDLLSNGDLFLRMFYEGDNKELEYIDDIANMNGFFYGVYSFKGKKALDAAVDLMERDVISISHLTIDEDDLTEISIDYLQSRIEKFEEQVDKSFEIDEPISGLDENPFSNQFYDSEYGGGRKHRKGPLTSSVQLGDNNV